MIDLFGKWLKKHPKIVTQCCGCLEWTNWISEDSKSSGVHCWNCDRINATLIKEEEYKKINNDEKKENIFRNAGSHP